MYPKFDMVKLKELADVFHLDLNRRFLMQATRPVGHLQIPGIDVVPHNTYLIRIISTGCSVT